MGGGFWLCFVPLFVAVDALGVLPMFMGLTEGLGSLTVRKIVVQSVVTAAIVARTTSLLSDRCVRGAQGR